MKTRLLIVVALALLAYRSTAQADDFTLMTGAVIHDANLYNWDDNGVTLRVNGTATKYPWRWFTAAEQKRIKAIGEAMGKKAAANRQLEKSAVVMMVEPFSFGKTTTMIWVQRYEKGGEILPDTYHPVGDREIAVLDEVWPVSSGKEKRLLKLYPLGVTDDSSRNPIFTSSAERAAAATPK